jgi:ribosomal protein S1
VTHDDPRQGLKEEELALLGTVQEGTVVTVFRGGVTVDLGLSCTGHLDVLYARDTSRYQVGQRIDVYLSHYDPERTRLWLRLPGQSPVV